MLHNKLKFFHNAIEKQHTLVNENFKDLVKKFKEKILDGKKMMEEIGFSEYENEDEEETWELETKFKNFAENQEPEDYILRPAEPKNRLKLEKRQREYVEQKLILEIRMSQDSQNQEELRKKHRKKRKPDPDSEDLEPMQKKERDRFDLQILPLRGKIDVLKTLKREAIIPGESFLEPKWDLKEEFLNNYNLFPVSIMSYIIPDERYDNEKLGERRHSYFSWMDLLADKEHLSELYHSIVMNFLRAGIRVKDL
jgi:hypothetical protein